MQLVTYKKLDDRLAVGFMRDGAVHALATDLSMRELAANNLPLKNENSFKVMNHKGLQAPVMPRKIFAVGRNYAEHAAELNNDLPTSPLIFSKYPTSVIASGQPIQWYRDVTQQVDWEGELVVVIGKGGRNIPEADAYDAIFGYTVANDVSARDIQSSESQWVRAKAQDTFCPLAPTIVTRDAVPDPHALTITTTVNGETMQNGSTADMIFKIPYLVAYLSRTFTLEAGDLILTGTPSGVGKAMTPPRFLNDGDQVTVTIDGIGTVTNPCQILDE